MPSTASAPGSLGRRRPSSVTGPEAAPGRPSAPPNPRARATADDLFGMDELTGDMSAQPGSPLSSDPNLARMKTAPPPPPASSVPPPPPAEDTRPPPTTPDPDAHAAVKLGAVKLAVRDPLADLAESIGGVLGAESASGHAAPEEASAPASVDPALARPVLREMVAVGMTGLIGIALALAVGAATGFINPPPPWMREGTVQSVIATQIASGLYNVSSPKPVFFIRGRIENHGVNTVGAVQVVADLIGTNGSVARVETVAGNEPSAEEVRELKTQADADAMVHKLAKASAGKLLSPGESEPFFALIADPPADAERDELRLTLSVAPLPMRQK
jgi:hypothetical protein